MPPLPQYVFMAWLLAKHRASFTYWGRSYIYRQTDRQTDAISESLHKTCKVISLVMLCARCTRLGNVNSYFLTPWSRILLGKLKIAHMVKKLLASYGNRSFITVFTRACHWTTAPDQSTPHPNTLLLKIHLNIIFTPTSKFPKWSLSFGFSYWNSAYICQCSLSCSCRSPAVTVQEQHHNLTESHFRSQKSLVSCYTVPTLLNFISNNK
jgi:hypothetical protein